MHSELCLTSGILVLLTLQCVDLCDFYVMMPWCRLHDLYRESTWNLRHLYQTTLCHVPEGQKIFCLYQLFCFFPHFSSFFLSFGLSTCLSLFCFILFLPFSFFVPYLQSPHPVSFFPSVFHLLFFLVCSIIYNPLYL